MPNQNEYGKRAVIARIHEQIELSWSRKYAQFLDLNGREPRPIDQWSLTIISAFFLVSWSISTWLGLAHMIPAIALTTIVSFASLRFSEFDRAYQQYSQRRAEIAKFS